MLIDPKPLWDFDDPSASEARLLAAADDASEPARSAWLTQVARAMGLQEKFDVAHAVLDSLAVSGIALEVAVRLDLERGRLYRSAGDAARALPLFEQAAARAERAGLDELRVDALHMAALEPRPRRRSPATRRRLLRRWGPRMRRPGIGMPRS